LNVKFLRTFVRVVENKSFTQAAEELHLTQPAVSFQIRSLEETYGVELLDRSGREIIPTASGRVLLTHARQILDLYARSQQEIDRLNDLVRGTLTVGASTGPGEHVLPQLLGRFKHRYPEIQVVLRISRTQEIIRQVQERTLEIGIVGARVKDDAILFQPFIKDDLIIIAAPQHRWAGAGPVRLNDVLQEPFILQQQGAGIRTMLESGLSERGLGVEDLNVYMELGLQESVKTAVAEGFGIGIISRFAVRQELALGTLVQVPVDDLPAFRDEFYLVRHRKRKLSRLTEVFLSYAKEQPGLLPPESEDK
jgi:DNA-binding transcriptional LysR family regulator